MNFWSDPRRSIESLDIPGVQIIQLNLRSFLSVVSRAEDTWGSVPGLRKLEKHVCGLWQLSDEDPALLSFLWLDLIPVKLDIFPPSDHTKLISYYITPTRSSGIDILWEPGAWAHILIDSGGIMKDMVMRVSVWERKRSWLIVCPWEAAGPSLAVTSRQAGRDQVLSHRDWERERE